MIDGNYEPSAITPICAHTGFKLIKICKVVLRKDGVYLQPYPPPYTKLDFINCLLAQWLLGPLSPHVM